MSDRLILVVGFVAIYAVLIGNLVGVIRERLGVERVDPPAHTVPCDKALGKWSCASESRTIC